MYSVFIPLGNNCGQLIFFADDLWMLCIFRTDLLWTLCVLCTDLLGTLYALYDRLWALTMLYYGSLVETIYTPVRITLSYHVLLM